MKFLYKILLILTLALLGYTSNSHATHIAGGNFTYTCVGQDSFLITLALWRDCAGIAAPNNVTVTFTNSCGTTFNQALTLQPGGGPNGSNQISDLCTSQLSQTTCNGGTLPGMEMYIYQAIVTFPPSCNGSISATATGGASGFTYTWPNNRTGPNQTGLCAGRYIVTVTDNNGCKANDTVTLLDPSLLNLNTTVTEITCNGACDGTVSVAATGGTAPYTFTWSNGASGATQNNLCPGQYAVTVMDNTGNQFREYITLNNPAPVAVAFTTINPTCTTLCDGMVRANVTGGTAPYTYAWTGGLTGATNGSVCAGTYDVTVTDANNCTATSSVTLTAPAALNASITQTATIACNATCTGTLNASATGGTAPYTYAWSDGSTNATNTNLCAGAYTVTITDANGCSDNTTFTITQPAAIAANETVVDAACGAACNGSITLAPTGGTGTYTYAWAGITPAPGNVATVTGLCAGAYTVTITDASSCTSVKTIVVKNTGMTATAAVTNVTCNGLCNGQITMTPTAGTAPYSYAWSNSATTAAVTGLCAGTYVVTITDNGGCKYVESFVLQNPDTIAPNATVTQPTCNTNCNATIALAPTGGNGTYTYAWSNSTTAATATGLCAGTYTVTITDGNSCQKIESFTIANPTFTASINILTNSSCSGICNGSLQAIPSGGKKPYTYAWSNTGSLPYNFDLCGGNYTVTVTDANGCTATSSVTLTTPAPIATNITTNTSPNCSGTWEMSYTTCCRNNALTNITNPGGASIYASATFNAAFEHPRCNSSVQYFNQYTGSIQGGCQYVSSLTYGCPGQQDCYVFLQTEPDGDSVIYSIVPPLTGPNTFATWATGFSNANPLGTTSTINFDSTTGELCYTVPQAGYYAFAMMAEEYDPVSGLFLGRTYRDIQLVILASCSVNYTPYAIGDSLHSFTTNSNANLVDTNKIVMCEGADFCFGVTFIDSNLVDTNLCLTTNARQLLVGPNPTDTATVAITAVDTLVSGTDSVLRISATICWTAPASSQGSYIVKVSCSDDHCPSPTTGEISIRVDVVGSTVVSPDVTICGSQTAQLQASGGNVFTWKALSGDSIIIGTNFSCDSCTSPIASPTQTTVYEVTSDLVGSCQFKDTVTVTVAQDYQVNAGPDTILCRLDTIPMYANPSVAGSYSFQWAPSGTLSNDTIGNPNAMPTQTTTYNITATSADGCVKFASTTITMTPLFPPVSVTATDTLLCDGDSTQASVVLGNTTPTACGLSTVPCYGTDTTSVIGTGTATNSATGYPAPFGNFRPSARHQFLVRATELTTAGFSAGLMTGIAFNVTAINGASTYNNFSVKVGCTSLNAMGFAWQPTSQVMAPSNVTLAVGWNWLNFDTPYMWDGTSNIIIETCFNNPAGTDNSSVTYTPTTFISTIYYANQTIVACTSTGITSGSFNRPNINFKFCAPASPGAYTYQWTPNQAITDTSIYNPMLYPPLTTTYQVIVNDTFGVCQDTTDITIHKAEIDAGNDTVICANDTAQLNPVINQTCATGTPVYSWTPTTGLSNPNILNPTATVNQTTTYHLTYTDPCGCILTDSVTVIVNSMSLPSINITPPKCGANDGKYLVQAVGGNAPYTFSIDSGNTFLIDSNFINLSQGIYHIVVKDSIGCLSDIRTDTLLNPGAPQVDSIVKTDLSCFAAMDGEIKIYASGGTQPLTYSIDSTNFFATNSFSSLNGGHYTIIVKDDSGCTTLPQKITLLPVAELQIDSVQTKNLNCFGVHQGEIKIFASGGTPPVQFSIDSGNVYQSGNSFDSLAAGNYYIILKDSKNCVTASQFQLITQPTKIDIDLAVTNDSCYNACGGFAVANVSGGFSPYTYNWVSNTAPPNPAGGNDTISANLCHGSYILHVKDSNNCNADTTFTVTTPDPLVIDSIPFKNITCNGATDGSFTLHISGGTKPYNYSTDGGVNFTQTYLDSIFVNNLAAGNYNIVVKDSNYRCSTSSSITLAEPSPVAINIPFTNKTLCVGNCLTLSATASGGNGSPFIYHWSESSMDSSASQTFCPTQDPKNDATVVVFAEDSKGCRSGFKSFVISLHDSLKVTGLPNDGVCPGESTQLQLTASGGDGNGFKYQWTPSASLNNPFTANPTATPGSTTKYFIKLTDNCGSPAVTDSIEVKVHPLPDIKFTYADTTQGCEPHDITLINQSTHAQSCFWTVGTAINAQGFSSDITDLKAGKYDVKLRVQTPKGCEDSKIYKDFITVFPKPTANFEFGPQPTTVFDSRINFKDLSSSNTVKWEWDFANLGNSKKQNPVYVFPTSDTGSYDVTLKAISDKSCENTITYTIKIGAEYNMYIPNSFTPNGDGLNDVFAPSGIGIEPTEYSMYIYDRWGNLVYETNSLTKPWDGRVKGSEKIAVSGSYVWKIVANDFTDDKNRNEYTGYINLLK